MRPIPLCLFVPFVLACGSTEPSEPTIQLEGTITAADDGSPVAGATISVGFSTGFLSTTTIASDHTDASGRYALSFETRGVGCKDYFVFVVANPLFLSNLSFDSGLRCTDMVQTLDFQLERDPTGG